MTSRERMLAALAGEQPDHTPCSFMLYLSLMKQCRTDAEYVERQVAMGLDAFVHVGHLNADLHRYGGLHPDVTWREWTEQQEGVTYFCRRIDTPAGPLTSRIRQREGWPTTDEFPLYDDLLTPRMEEALVDPERDLAKVKYLFGPLKDDDVRALAAEAKEAGRQAQALGLLQVGGWKGRVRPGLHVEPGVMGCDAMAWLSDMEGIMALGVLRPDVVAEYARIIHEWNMRQLEVYLDRTAAELIVRRGWYETTEFWTPAGFRAIIAPTLRREAALVHQAGRRFGYIITSAFLPLLDDILDAGVDVLIGLDPAEGKGTRLAEIKERFRGRHRALWGGVSGAITVEMGTEEETEEAVRTALRTLGAGGGFILSPVDNIREDTEKARRNTRRFIETWQRYRALP
jgi:uroporphyrinogen-III decarboxylase